MGSGVRLQIHAHALIDRVTERKTGELAVCGLHRIFVDGTWYARVTFEDGLGTLYEVGGGLGEGFVGRLNRGGCGVCLGLGLSADTCSK